MMMMMMISMAWRFQVLVALYALTHIQCEAAAAVCGKSLPNITDDELHFHHYAIVIDAGSSGSRIRVYAWRVEEGSQRLPDFKQTFSSRTTPGVSECRSNAEIQEHILKLVNAATPCVPEKLRAKSSIYFMATAGMRMMLEDKANDATNFIDGLLSDPTHNPFLYLSPDNARVLSGEEEGIFAWIAANYLAKTFTDYGKKSLNTRGILELGGASTQIAFAPPGNIFDNKYPVTVAGVTYSLYVHSYLIYGQDQVDVWIKDRLYREAGFTTSVSNPCMLKGDSSVRAVNGTDVTFAGDGDPAACLALLGQLLYRPEQAWRCNPKPCGIGSTYQPTIHSNMQFSAVGAFLYPLRGLRVLNPDGTFSLENVTAAARKFCSTPLSDLKQQRNLSAESRALRMLSRECLTGLYMPILFEKAYRFRNDTTQIRAPVGPERDEMEWPLGAVIYEYERHRCDVHCPLTCPSLGSNSASSVHGAASGLSAARLLTIVGILLTAVLRFKSL